MFLLMFVAFGSIAQTKEKDKELEKQSANISKELSLDSKTEHLVYNVLYHVKRRILDTPMGHPKYEKLISYIDDERVSMMRSLLSVNQYKQYDKIFGNSEKEKIKEIIAKNDEYVATNGVLKEETKVAELRYVYSEPESESEQDKEE